MTADVTGAVTTSGAKPNRGPQLEPSHARGHGRNDSALVEGWWPSRLTVDAFGAVPFNVSLRRGAMSRFVRVELGTVVLNCMDAVAVSSMASAWAMASRVSESLPSRPRVAGDVVGTWPPPSVSEHVVAGASRWRVIAPRPGAAYTHVTGGWLTVRVFDQVALELHTRVWALASDVGRRAWPERPPARFRDLMMRARFDEDSLSRTVQVER